MSSIEISVSVYKVNDEFENLIFSIPKTEAARMTVRNFLDSYLPADTANGVVYRPENDTILDKKLDQVRKIGKVRLLVSLSK